MNEIDDRMNSNLQEVARWHGMETIWQARWKRCSNANKQRPTHALTKALRPQKSALAVQNLNHSDCPGLASWVN